MEAMLLELWLGLIIAAEAAAFGNTRRFLRRSRARSRQQWPAWEPSVSVLVPCKGTEPGLARNLRAIAAQRYRKAEFLFIVDSLSEPAVPIVRRLQRSGRRIKLLVTEPAPGYSGKIAALRTGVRRARGSVLVFADMDIAPGRDWLRTLIAPLADPRIPATTGYRWYVPIRGRAAECLRCVWDAVGLSVEFTERYAFFWGGSAAIRRSTFKKLGIVRRWRGQFSDDSVMTLALRARGQAPFFVPGAVSPSCAENRAGELVEWTNRQIWLTRLYNRKAWRHALLAFGFFAFVAATGFAALIAGLWNTRYIPFGILLLALPALGRVARHRWLQLSYQRLLPAHAERLQRFAWRVALCAALAPLLLFYNLLRAPALGGIEWRGNRYEKAKRTSSARSSARNRRRSP